MTLFFVVSVFASLIARVSKCVHQRDKSGSHSYINRFISRQSKHFVCFINNCLITNENLMSKLKETCGS